MPVLSIVCVILCVDFVMGFPTTTLDDKQDLWTEQYGSTQSSRVTVRPNYRQRLDNMYFLPKELGNGDKFDIDGIFTENRNSFRIILGTDNETERVFEFEANFVTNEVIMKIVQNGQTTIIEDFRTTSDNFNGSSFSLTFEATKGNDNSHVLEFYIDGNPFQTIELLHNHEEINHVIIDGDVKVNRLSFSFA